jgi:hypothetical protein
MVQHSFVGKTICTYKNNNSDNDKIKFEQFCAYDIEAV